jgi:hypothetical protein
MFGAVNHVKVNHRHCLFVSAQSSAAMSASSSPLVNAQ